MTPPGLPLLPGPGFAPLLRAIERDVVAALALSPLPLDPALARAEGVWRDEPVAIETRAYAGGQIRYARFATVVGGGLEIGNALCLSVLENPLPMFGMDLVGRSASGRWQAMVAADLSPTHPDAAAGERQLLGLGRRLAPFRDALPTAGELPAWCARWFSSHAIFSRPSPEAFAAAGAAVREMAMEFVRLASSAAPESAAAARHVVRVQDAYTAAHRADDKGLTLLARIFGGGWAGEYVRQVLFPDSANVG